MKFKRCRVYRLGAGSVFCNKPAYVSDPVGHPICNEHAREGVFYTLPGETVLREFKTEVTEVFEPRCEEAVPSEVMSGGVE